MLTCSLAVKRPKLGIEATFSVDGGETLCLFGPSGSGKTSLLLAISGLLRARGRVTWRDVVWLDSENNTFVPPWRRRLGLVGQSNLLFPHLTVRDNLGFGLEGDAKGVVHRLAERLELGAYLDRYPRELSGGLAQRVQLGRALAPEPPVLLLDEPFSALDSVNRRSLQDLMLALRQDLDVAMVFVTHDLAEAQRMGTTLGVIHAGRLCDVGPMERVTMAPSNPTVAKLLGYQVLKHSDLVLNGDPNRMMLVHPDRVRMGRHPQQGLLVRAKVTGVEPYFTGARAHLMLESGRELEARVSPWEPLSMGDTLTLTLIGLEGKEPHG